jgi:hypothetical protein
VTNLTKAKLIYLVLLASLFAYILACFNVLGLAGINGMSDGGGFM